MTTSRQTATAATLGQAMRDNALWLAAGVVVIAVTYAGPVWTMANDWYTDDNASHGFFIPLISGYLVWTRRKELAVAPVSSSLLGLLMVAAAAVMLVAGWLGSERFTARFSLIVALGGCVLYWMGRDVFRLVSTPLAFLTFMIPIPAIVYDAAAFPLKLLVSKIAVAALKAVGIMVVREGNVIMLPNITLEVADACSGMRSLTSLLALATAYSLIFVDKGWLRVVLIASAVPIAVLCNVLRVFGTGVLARYFGAAAAEGFFHEFAGLAVFILALIMVYGLDRLLRRVWS